MITQECGPSPYLQLVLVQTSPSRYPMWCFCLNCVEKSPWPHLCRSSPFTGHYLSDRWPYWLQLTTTRCVFVRIIWPIYLNESIQYETLKAARLPVQHLLAYLSNVLSCHQWWRHCNYRLASYIPELCATGLLQKHHQSVTDSLVIDFEAKTQCQLWSSALLQISNVALKAKEVVLDSLWMVLLATLLVCQLQSHLECCSLKAVDSVSCMDSFLEQFCTVVGVISGFLWHESTAEFYKVVSIYGKIKLFVCQKYGIFISRARTQRLEMLVDIPGTCVTKHPHICLVYIFVINYLLQVFNGKMAYFTALALVSPWVFRMLLPMEN